MSGQCQCLGRCEPALQQQGVVVALRGRQRGDRLLLLLLLVLHLPLPVGIDAQQVVADGIAKHTRPRSVWLASLCAWTTRAESFSGASNIQIMLLPTLI